MTPINICSESACQWWSLGSWCTSWLTQTLTSLYLMIRVRAHMPLMPNPGSGHMAASFCQLVTANMLIYMRGRGFETAGSAYGAAHTSVLPRYYQNGQHSRHEHCLFLHASAMTTCYALCFALRLSLPCWNFHCRAQMLMHRHCMCRATATTHYG